MKLDSFIGRSYDMFDKTDQSFNSSTFILNNSKKVDLNKKFTINDDKLNFINNELIRDILKQHFISDQELKKTLKHNEKFIMAFETLSGIVIDQKLKNENLEKELIKILKENSNLKSEILIFSKNLIECNKKNNKLKKEITEIKLGNLSNSAIVELRSPIRELNLDFIDVNHLKFINDNANGNSESYKPTKQIIQNSDGSDNNINVNNENFENLNIKEDL